MPTTVKFYKNEEKRKQYLKRNKKRYYSKNIENCTHKNNIWTDEEIKRILFAPKTDTELSIELNRSINSIQIKRSRAKKNILKYI